MSERPYRFIESIKGVRQDTYVKLASTTKRKTNILNKENYIQTINCFDDKQN